MVIYDKYFSYFLGFLWSDGFVERYRIGIEILKDDADDIFNDIKKIEFLNICEMNRHRKNRRPQSCIYFCNASLYDSYFSKYYINKSHKSAIDIIMDIPISVRRYFYLGLIDGDGCFYYNKKNRLRQFYVTSCFDQDWSHMEYLFSEIGVSEYEIRRVENRNGNRSSYIRVKKYDEISSLFGYLYPDGYDIGLKRKYNKCKEIVDDKVKGNNKSKIDIFLLVEKIEEYSSILEVAKYFNCNWRKIYEFCKKHDIKYPKGFFSGV